MGRVAMRTLEELLEEAKRRTILFLIFVLTAAYCMSLTSNSVILNIPVAILVCALLRRIFLELDIRFRPPDPGKRRQHYYKRTVYKDPLLLAGLPHASISWKQKIDSPAVEAAVDNLVQRLVAEWVTDLWYSLLTPDQEAPNEIRAAVNGAIGEVAARIKQVNLINLLTRDVVNLVGSHIQLYREAQAAIGHDYFGTLSSEVRDQHIKRYLSSMKKLHPAVKSADAELQVLQRLTSGVLAIVLKPEDAQCKVFQCIARELLACAVLRPLLNLASPLFINQLIEALVISSASKQNAALMPSTSSDGSYAKTVHEAAYSRSLSVPGVELADVGQAAEAKVVEGNRNQRAKPSEGSRISSDHITTAQSGDWSHALDAFTQKKTQALAPEHLDNLWAKGRNYKKKENPQGKGAELEPLVLGPETSQGSSELRNLKRQRSQEGNFLLERTTNPVSVDNEYYGGMRDRLVVVGEDSIGVHSGNDRISVIHHPLEVVEPESSPRHQRSRSLEAFDKQERAFDSRKRHVANTVTAAYKPKLSCRVIGAHYEKTGSKSFAVYSISVSDAEDKTWVVLRRYRNFEQLHRRLRDMPHYTLSLPPKRFLSSNLDHSFVRERCILLNKYLKDLLAIPSIAELHEVWDFLSFKSQNYGFGEPVSIIKALAVNVDDAVDDVFRQIKGVSKKNSPSCLTAGETAAWNTTASTSSVRSEGANASQHSDDDGEEAFQTGWHSDSELHLESRLGKTAESLSDGHSPAESLAGSDANDDEWTPPKLTVPLLNLVDIVFQLEGRGWIRRQVLWIAKQVLQLGMADAIDDWLLSRIQYLRREDVVASGIKWIENVLWPNGVFITKQQQQALQVHQQQMLGGTPLQPSFEDQLEAARRAMVVRELIQDQAPSALVSLIGRKQYQRSAKDIYGFLQSNVCVKQLAFNLLEKLLAAAFPEMEELIAP